MWSASWSRRPVKTIDGDIAVVQIGAAIWVISALPTGKIQRNQVDKSSFHEKSFLIFQCISIIHESCFWTNSRPSQCENKSSNSSRFPSGNFRLSTVHIISALHSAYNFDGLHALSKRSRSGLQIFIGSFIFFRCNSNRSTASGRYSSQDCIVILGLQHWSYTQVRWIVFAPLAPEIIFWYIKCILLFLSSRNSLFHFQISFLLVYDS